MKSWHFDKEENAPLQDPRSQATFQAPSILVQSCPLPRVAHPPQDSNSVAVSKHSYCPENPLTGHASRPDGQRVTRVLVERLWPPLL